MNFDLATHCLLCLGWAQHQVAREMEGQDISGAEVHRTLDGKAVAAEIRRELAGQVAAERAKDPTFSPGLAILQVGGREDSNVYIRMKTKAAQEVCTHVFES